MFLKYNCSFRLKDIVELVRHFFMEKANNNRVIKLLLHHGNRKETKPASDPDHLRQNEAKPPHTKYPIQTKKLRL